MTRTQRALLALLFLGLAACKGGSSSSSTPSGTALLRFLQAAPSLGAVDWQIDAGGVRYTGATYGLIQGYQTVSAASHTVLPYAAATNDQVGPASGCVTPTLAANSRNTIVLSSTTTCAFFVEPSVSVPSGGAYVVYHNVSTSATTLYPLFCVAVTPVTSCLNQTQFGQTTTPVTSSAVTNSSGSSGAGAVQVAVPATLGSTGSGGTTGSGIAVSAASSASAQTPVCTSPVYAPTLLPSAVDNLDTSNFLPNGTTDTVYAVFIYDAPNTNGASCALAETGTFIP